jgi:hypothetical protein
MDSLARTVAEMLCTVLPGYWCADNNYGEMFLNFPLHEDLQKYCGVDLSQIMDNKINVGAGPAVGVWTRNATGLRPTLYASVQGLLRAKQMVLGDHKDKANPYHWEWVYQNLPGDESYDPTLPWIAKIRHESRQVAADVPIYVNNCCITAPTQDLAWLAARCMAKVCLWLGLQDAAQKRREPSTTPGAWAGVVIWTLGGKRLGRRSDGLCRT